MCADLVPVIGSESERAGETAAQGDKGVHPEPWPPSVFAASPLWRMAGPGSAMPEVASDGANLWFFQLLANATDPSFAGSASSGPDCACAETHMAIRIADAKIPTFAIQMVLRRERRTG